MAESKTPEMPSLSGKQYDENTSYVGSHPGEFTNELPDSLPESTGATPGVGAFDFNCGTYDTEHTGGYGVEVSAPSSVSSMSVSNTKSERGDEK